MAPSGILDSYYNIAASIGLPPLALVCLVALFIFILIFGLIILSKIRIIRRDLMTVNKGLDTIAQRIEQKIESSKAKNGHHHINGDDIKIEPQKQVVRISDKTASKKRLHFTKINGHNTTRQIKKRPDPRDNLFLDTEFNSSDIKNKILNLLKKTSRPISYHEIAESLSQNSRDHDFNSILKELDQLEKKGDIIGQVMAGKLYFQITKEI